MTQIGQYFFGILEAPLADIKPLDFFADKLLGIVGWIPRLEKDVPEDNMVYTLVCDSFGRGVLS